MSLYKFTNLSIELSTLHFGIASHVMLLATTRYTCYHVLIFYTKQTESISSQKRRKPTLLKIITRRS